MLHVFGVSNFASHFFFLPNFWVNKPLLAKSWIFPIFTTVLSNSPNFYKTTILKLNPKNSVKNLNIVVLNHGFQFRQNLTLKFQLEILCVILNPGFGF